MAGEINTRVGRRIEGATDGNLYQTVGSVLVPIVRDVGGAIPTGYVVTRQASGLWAASAAATGLPAGGVAGDVLTKQSGTDGDADWEAPSGGGGGSPAFAFTVECSDETTAITTGTAKKTFRWALGAATITEVRASVTTAPTGAAIIIDINKAGGATSILSTKLSIDAGEETSETAATPPVLTGATITDDEEITIDFDQVGSTVAGTGVKVTFIGTVTGGGGGGGGASVYTPGKNAAAHADDDDFSSDSGAWTNVNWSGWGTLDYSTTVPGALYIRSVNTGTFTLCAKLKAIPSGSWSKVLDVTPPMRNHGGFPVGMILSTTNSAGSGNQSIFGVYTYGGGASSQVHGYSNFAGFNGQQINASGWGWGPRALLRWDRISGVDTIYWGGFDPYSGEHWGGGHVNPFYGGVAYYGIVFARGTNGEPPPDMAFHGFYHFPTSYPARGMSIEPA